MIDYKYAEYAWEQAASLLAIDSPSGFTAKAVAWLKEQFEGLGFVVTVTTKGGLLVDLGGKNNEDSLMLAAHADTLGGMVAEIKGSGRLRLTNLGGMKADNGEAENVRVYTRDGRIYEGTLQLCNASVHVNGDYSTAKRNFDTQLPGVCGGRNILIQNHFRGVEAALGGAVVAVHMNRSVT